MNIVEYSPYALAHDTGTANSILGWSEALVRQGCNVTLLVDGRRVSRPPPPSNRVIDLGVQPSDRRSDPPEPRAESVKLV